MYEKLHMQDLSARKILLITNLHKKYVLGSTVTIFGMNVHLSFTISLSKFIIISRSSKMTKVSLKIIFTSPQQVTIGNNFTNLNVTKECHILHECQSA